MPLLDSLEERKRQSLMDMLAEMTSKPQPVTDPALRKQFPQTYGFLGGLMGTAPDQFEGSVLDPLSAQVRAGAEYGFPIGTLAQVLPAAPFTKGLPIGASTKAVGGMEFLGTPKNAPLFAPVSPAGMVSGDMAALFAQKAARERALAKKSINAADQVATNAPAKKKTGKVQADIFRRMENELGSDAALAAARRGDHLKPDGYGGYVGAPRYITSPQSLGSMRTSLSDQFDSGVSMLNHADPARMGTWYDRAKAAQRLTNEPWQLPRSLDQHAVYSAGVAPESELGFALKHQVSRALGEPDMAYRTAPMKTLDTAVAEDRLPNLGFKVGEYRNKNDPDMPNTGMFGVNDFRAAQGFGYTTPDGKIWKGGVSKTMHPFMDAETALTVDRANKAAVGGRLDWQGPHIQEVPWVLGKAQDLYRRGKGKTGRYNANNFGGDENAAMGQAIKDANNTFEDYLYKHTGSATHESIPGASTGHVSQMLTAPQAEKEAYTQAGSWSLLDSLGTDKDALYGAAGFRQLPELPSSGGYLNSVNQFETNPMSIARPLIDFPTGGGGGRVAGSRASTMDAIEQMRAAVDAQEAGAWNLPNTMKGVKGKNSAVIDSRSLPGGSATSGVQPSGAALSEANSLLDPLGYGVSATSRGVSIFPFFQSASPKDLAKVLKTHGQRLQELFPGDLQKSVSSSGYVPGIGKWGDTKIVPTAPFSGEATAGLLESMANAPAEVARNISESEGVRSAIKKIISRDNAAGNARADIQEMRRFLSEADWSKAVDMIRSGIKPAAALAAMGYSINSMAGEN